MSDRPSFKDFKAQQMRDPAFREAYDALEDGVQLKRQMIAMRKAAGLTQREVAERLGTKAGNISRLESLSATHSPSMATVESYARVLGFSMKVRFEPCSTTADNASPPG